ncbi:aklavinone 12-hydroxylase RdmE [Amycolatopsis sp. NPDC059021]|uniref:aklavinone 12-hydroxylase RdmE n=1 Tax=Amycolatopsis sp. NPDC059021 TaxID=3346704 RepID=UPI003671878E
MEERVQVLVAGAGLGGLSATMFLAQRGIDVLTVERHASTAIHTRATGQNPRTMELFRWAGIDDAVLNASPRASKGLRITVAPSLAGPVFNRIMEDFNEPDFSAATSMPFGMAGQEVVEPILLAQAEKFCARVRFRTELVTFTQDADGVTATLRHRDSGEETVVRADYLVAADGGRSGIREGLGIAVEGKGTLGHCLGVVFDADLGDRVKPGITDLFYLQHPEFVGGLSNTDIPGRYVFSLDYYPEKGQSPADFPPERIAELIRLATDLPELEPRIQWTGPWEIAARVAERFRSGRVFLVGDAAKVTPPTGGQGGNTAVGDGADLAWKLAAVLDGDAGDELLDTYEAERRPIAQMIVNTSLHHLKERMQPDLDVSDLAPPEDSFAAMLGFRYRSTAVIAEDDDPARCENPLEPSGRPGFRFPDVPITVDGFTKSTVDVLGGDWVVLCAEDGSRWCPAVADVAAETGIRIACHVLDTAPAARSGLATGGASLVRPDGIVAWRSAEPSEDPAGELWNALGRVLSR